MASAADGDTIVICPGTYAENVSDTGKALTFDSQTQNAGDVTVDGGGGTAFTLTGSGTSLNHLTLIGATTAADTPAAFLQGADESVINSVFDGDSNGATITGTTATLSHDVVQNPNQAFDDGAGAAGFFFNSGGGSGSHIDSNTFSGTFDDAGYSIVRNNIDHVNASAVSIAGGFGYPSNGGGDISDNAFTDGIRGINATDFTGTITANLNILVGNTSGGTPSSPNAAIRNTTTASIAASNNYYGCDGGPGTAGCDDVIGVDARPFLVLSTTVGTTTLSVGDSTSFTADLNHNNAGALVNGHVLDNVETVAFTFDKGNVNPASKVLTGGTASTVITADTAGQGTATATVENSSSSKTITVSGSGGGGGGKASLRISDATTIEGNSGTHAIKFPVRLSKTTSANVTVHFTTVDGSAKAGSDYIAKSGTLSIAHGKKQGVISVLVKGDKVKEPSEAFFVTLTNPSANATIADPNGTGTITNDD